MPLSHRQYVADALGPNGPIDDPAISARDRGVLARYLAGESADAIGRDHEISGERVKDICSRIAHRATGCGWLRYRQCATVEEGRALLHAHREAQRPSPGGSSH